MKAIRPALIGLPAPRPDHHPLPLLLRVAKLRQLMGEATDLAVISRYFDDALISDDRFLDAGAPRDNFPLLGLVRAIVRTVLSETSPFDTLLVYAPDYGLWHGLLTFRSGRMAQIIYFEDINRGLCSAGTWSEDIVHRFRFSLPTETIAPDDLERAQVIRLPRRQPWSASN